MSLVIDGDSADANSRLTAIRVAILTTRCMEIWRRGTRDAVTAMIMVAVVAIRSERLTRGKLGSDLKSLSQVVPDGLLGTCNVSSIAAATGLNRETARRRVNALIQSGSLVRTEDGEIALPPGRVQEPEIREMIRKHLEAITRFVNESMRDGVLCAK